MAPMIWWLLTAFLSYWAVPLVRPIFQSQPRKNYLKETVPTSLGVAFVLVGSFVMVVRGGREEYAYLFALVSLFFAKLGLVDDVYGEESRKGFRGHFRIGTVSTGVLKAWGGMVFSLAIVWRFSAGWFQLFLHGAIIALGANFLNLLDLRPGRGGKVFVLLGLLLFLVEPKTLDPLLVMVWAVAGYLPWDLRRVVMMGDVGSNSLGAVLGLASVLVLPFFGKIVLACVLVLLNVFAERVSFSRIIESNRFLRFLDELGR